MDLEIKIDELSYEVDNRNLSLTGDEKKIILNDISFTIFHGEIFGITGESGCGKTTLVKILSGIFQPSQGSVNFNFPVSPKHPSPVQVLFQNNDELLNPLRKVDDYLNELGTYKDSVREICDLLEIPGKILSSKCYQLSGGERQRVALARILKSKPQLLILDEPFSAQDPDSVIKMSALIKKIKATKNITVICVSHDIGTLASIADRIGVMYGGKLVEISIPKILLQSTAHPYSKFLVNSIDYKLNRKNFGDAKSINFNSACPYYNRCEKRIEKCITNVDKKITEKELLFCNNPY